MSQIAIRGRYPGPSAPRLDTTRMTVEILRDSDPTEPLWIRIGDKDHLDFWMEIAIPRAEFDMLEPEELDWACTFCGYISVDEFPTGKDDAHVCPNCAQTGTAVRSTENG